MTNLQQSSQQNKLETSANIGAPLSQDNLGLSSDVNEIRSQPNEKNDSTCFLKAAEEEHQYLREYIRNADQKAVFFFTVFSGLLAFLYSHQVSSRWLKSLSSWNMLDFVAFLSMTGLALSAALFLWVVIPRLKGSTRGLIFFRAIATYENSDEYVADMLRSSPVDLIRAKLKHCYELAKVCNAKYNKLLWGLYVGVIGVVSTLLYLLLA